MAARATPCNVETGLLSVLRYWPVPDLLHCSLLALLGITERNRSAVSDMLKRQGVTYYELKHQAVWTIRVCSFVSIEL
eukprot:6206341-Pleurochrysis_carterae.AAC.3